MLPVLPYFMKDASIPTFSKDARINDLAVSIPIHPRNLLWLEIAIEIYLK